MKRLSSIVRSGKYFRGVIYTSLALIGLASPLSADDLTATISQVTGKVEIQTVQGWVPARAGQTIDPGVTISTGFRSEAVLNIGPSIVTVKALTRMTLRELAEKEGLLSTDLYLRVGSVKADVRPASTGAQTFKVQSPISTASVRGTSFDFDGENLIVQEGTVSVGDNFGALIDVPQGEQTKIDPNGISGPQDNLAIIVNNTNTQTNPLSVNGLPSSGTGDTGTISSEPIVYVPIVDDDDDVVVEDPPVVVIIVE